MQHLRSSKFKNLKSWFFTVNIRHIIIGKILDTRFLRFLQEFKIVRIVKIKDQYKFEGNFSFRLATTEEVKVIIRDLPTNKAAGGEIPVNLIEEI